jgi:hypothetical protein
MNWIEEQAKEKNPQHNRVVLENPVIVRELEDTLLNDFYPFVRMELEISGYPYFPSPIELTLRPEIGLNGVPARSFTFMLLDDLSYSFFRGKLTITERGYMLDKEFHLGLPRSTDSELIFRILSEERYKGNPPSLHIEEESELFPDWNTYYYIELLNGSGIEADGTTVHNTAKDDIKNTIENSIEMYERSMVEGMDSLMDVEEFISISYRNFTSY